MKNGNINISLIKICFQNTINSTISLCSKRLICAIFFIMGQEDVEIALNELTEKRSVNGIKVVRFMTTLKL